jgi:hypothetical protein
MRRPTLGACAVIAPLAPDVACGTDDLTVILSGSDSALLLWPVAGRPIIPASTCQH